MKDFNEKKKMMNEIYVYGFAVDDVKLYLDTHPGCCEALAYFHRMQDALETARQNYTEAFGPLEAIDVDVADGWTWVRDPWPWEGGAC
ncbi:MAG: spore coat protein CotJB [Lachnospiraceae bacterium]|nr:spore coat protein CotJB [Lachnospiraceae bacterium]